MGPGARKQNTQYRSGFPMPVLLGTPAKFAVNLEPRFGIGGNDEIHGGSDAILSRRDQFRLHDEMPKLFDGRWTPDGIGDDQAVRLQFEAAPVSEPACGAFGFQNVLISIDDAHRRFIDPSEWPSGGRLVEASGTNGVVCGAGSEAVASRGIAQIAEGSRID